MDRPAEVASAGLPVIGRGAVLYAEAFPDRDRARRTRRPRCWRAVVATGTLEVVAPEPLYLRRPDVTMSGRPKSVLLT